MGKILEESAVDPKEYFANEGFNVTVVYDSGVYIAYLRKRGFHFALPVLRIEVEALFDIGVRGVENMHEAVALIVEQNLTAYKAQYNEVSEAVESILEEGNKA